MDEKKQAGEAGSENKPQDTKNEEKEKTVNPVLKTLRIVLLIAAVIFLWYIFSDRFTPYTNQARVTGIIIPVTPRVSGYLVDVKVRLHSAVKANQLLFQIDTSQYVLAVKRAEAYLENVIQQLGAQSAGIKAAASRLGISKAQLDRAQRNYNRVKRITEKNPGALSRRDIDQAETALDQTLEQVASAEANLAKAKIQFGPAGEKNPQLRMAINDLNNAQLQLAWTKIYAPTDGYIESFNMDVGYYCQAGKPIVTLVSKEDLWIQANFKENNLSKMKAGNEADFILDIAPGRIFSGKVRSIGYGVQSGNGAVPGDLPSISGASSWLQDPQRFPVIVTFTDTTAKRLCRAGGQADVVIYTGNRPILNAIAKVRIWINSVLSYLR